MKKIFESERLIYSQLSEDDFENYCEMDLDPEVMRFYTNRPHGTVEAAKTSFQKYLAYQTENPGYGGFMAFEKGTDKFIGLGVLIHLESNPENREIEVGYRLPVREWNKGYATEICKAILHYGFKSLNLNEIYGTTNPDNTVSQKVLMKAGLSKIGSWSNYGGCTAFRIIRSN